MVSQASISADHGKKTGAFRVRFSKENQFVKVGKQTTLAAEKLISGKTDMRVDRVNPQNEYWFIIRRENIGFFGKLLRKRKTTEKALHKGELTACTALKYIHALQTVNKILVIITNIHLRYSIRLYRLNGYGSISGKGITQYFILLDLSKKT